MHTQTSARRLIRAMTIAMLMAAAPLAGAHAQEASSIVIKNFDFAPMTLTVAAGASVTWKNLDGEPHTVTSVDGLFRSGAIDQNESFTFKFDKPGTYKYLCSIHPRMTAEIIVQ
jgi:plastocyanin